MAPYDCKQNVPTIYVCIYNTSLLDRYDVILVCRCPPEFLYLYREFGGNLWIRDGRGQQACEVADSGPALQYLRHFQGRMRVRHVTRVLSDPPDTCTSVILLTRVLSDPRVLCRPPPLPPEPVSTEHKTSSRQDSGWSWSPPPPLASSSLIFSLLPALRHGYR